MKLLRSSVGILAAAGFSAAAFLLLMVGAFWAIFVLPLAVFIVLVVVFSALAANRPEHARRHRAFIVDPAAIRVGANASSPAGTGPLPEAFTHAKEGGDRPQ